MIRLATILLVDDDPGDRKLVKQSLRNQRVANELKTADSGEAALEYLKHSQNKEYDYPMPDLVLLDLNMPGMGGKELLKRLKADPALSHIPVVILTTSDSDKDILESFTLQASGYVKKPVTLGEFQKVLTNLTDYWFVICKNVDSNQGVCDEKYSCTIN